MSSNLACIGLDLTDESEFHRVVGLAAGRATVLGERDGNRILRWQDDDGARLVLVLDGSRSLVAVTPSFASEPGAVLGSLTHANEECWTAAVTEDGEQVTALAADLEQSALVGPGPAAGGRAGVVALGTDVHVLPDVAAFEASPASLLDPDRAEHGEPPAHYAENGWPWPPRMSAESFVSYGVFGDAAQAEPFARLNGTVLRSRTCRNSLTGGVFHVARVRTVGFEADVCLAAAEHPDAPPPGSVVAGRVYLVAALETLPATQPSSRRGSRLPWRR
ncbi:hypothetical protein [Cellulomonas sp. NS3]|uniref:hypothetical protein n=1 Tax=Cellulomonas sp. NS3 TaxID=2973977 RepID=UPI002163D566|nr:hypothetical protein [Cellulomonas sp. NS3]